MVTKDMVRCNNNVVEEGGAKEGDGQRLMLAGGAGISFGVEQWKIPYDMVQDDHVSGLQMYDFGKGCWNTEDQANLEAEMLVSLPQGY